MKRRVVITGLGTLNPLGNDVAATWEALQAGKSGISRISQFDATDHKVQIAGEVKGFDPVAHFGRKDARRMERISQLALAAANQALEDAKLNGVDRDRVGVALGSGVGALSAMVENTHVLQEKGPSRISPFFMPMMLPDTPAATISIAHGFRGPNMAIATACASGNNALGEAARTIAVGAADVMVAGGSEACIMPLAIAAFSVMGALSTRNDAPEEASRPFDSERDGFVSSEGAAMLILESLAHAQERGARIYGELLGYGSSADAYHVSMPADDGGGAALAMQRALDDAGLAAADIDYINAHGTSTPLNDKSETKAIKRVFGERAYDVPVSSTKSMHGHLLGAAGALEALICLLALDAGVAPPTINYTFPDADCDLDYVPNVAREVSMGTAMSNGFGLGGHNATLILGRGPDT